MCDMTNPYVWHDRKQYKGGCLHLVAPKPSCNGLCVVFLSLSLYLFSLTISLSLSLSLSLARSLSLSDTTRQEAIERQLFALVGTSQSYPPILQVDMTPSYVCHGSCIYVKCLHMCAMTHAYVFMCVP